MDRTASRETPGGISVFRALVECAVFEMAGDVRLGVEDDEIVGGECNVPAVERASEPVAAVVRAVELVVRLRLARAFVR